ncbi:beta-N-acetylhexosaminidase [Lunatimonas lonarensis]|nr:beta-N-acetylhexosaminidase [Lunatimonas lonarensis]
MKRIMLLLLLVTILSTSLVEAQQEPPLIPLPADFSLNVGNFLLDREVAIRFPNELASEAAYFRQELFRKTGIPVITRSGTDSRIELGLDPELTDAYRLSITPGLIQVIGADPDQVHHGLVSLIQLAESYMSDKQVAVIPSWQIEDRAGYGWRGLMLDESRYFFGVEKVKQILDYMSYYKLNRLHWHLTDSPGWRIEIKKYPKLALVGGIGDHHDPNKPSAFYTQEEIKEIVRYAAERKITVIPEIDMPGHATAANRAYPEFSGGGSAAYPEFTFHPGKEATYAYLTEVLQEVNTLFPSAMIHLGGDEVSFGNEKWASDPDVKRLMQQEGLKDLKAVEDYFIQRMADSVIHMGSKVLAWDEMADATLSKYESIIFWWRHDRPEQLELALKNGYATVVCPRIPYYFDFVQEDFHQFGRKWAGVTAPLQAAYEFSLDDLPISSDFDKDLILGLQANLWTETVHNSQRIDFLLFPRIAALAEAAWTPAGAKKYADFMLRLDGHLPRYERDGIYFYHPRQPEYHPEPVYRP